VVDNLLNSEDVHYMLGALRTLGLSVEADKAAKRAVVVGCGGKFPVEDAKEEVQLFLGNAGTAMRPLTAAVTAAGGNATYVSSLSTILVGVSMKPMCMSSGLWCIGF
jgi:3-phosphoshikimate 1-carboxyvinyltransferase